LGRGGAGGNVPSGTGSGGDGGLGTATLIVNSAGGLSHSVTTTGGRGGSGQGVGQQAGAGGLATGSASITASGTASVGVSATGGIGGFASLGADAGAGGNAILLDAASGSSPVDLRLRQTAIGGDGGNASDGGTAGRGGDATSIYDATNPAGGDLRVENTVRGGQGGEGFTTSHAGAGGDAVARTQATAEPGADLIVDASAVAGSAAEPAPGTLGASGGRADASATGIGTAETRVDAYASGGRSTDGTPDGAARAFVSATGASGLATANAGSGGGLVSSVSAAGFVQLAGRPSEARSTADVAGPAARLASAASLEAAAFATGLPTQSDVASALMGNPDAMAVLGNHADFLGSVVLGAASAGELAGLTLTNTSRTSFHLDMSTIADPRDLVIGFLDTEAAGAGTLSVQVYAESLDVFEETFDDLAEAAAFFDDRVLNLGDWTMGLSGNLDVELVLSFTSADPTGRFAVNMLLANVPEPSSALLLVAGIGCLAAARSSRRSAGGCRLPRRTRGSRRCG
jgi:hypothetical protein